MNKWRKDVAKAYLKNGIDVMVIVDKRDLKRKETTRFRKIENDLIAHILTQGNVKFAET